MEERKDGGKGGRRKGRMEEREDGGKGGRRKGRAMVRSPASHTKIAGLRPVSTAKRLCVPDRPEACE